MAYDYAPTTMRYAADVLEELGGYGNGPSLLRQHAETYIDLLEAHRLIERIADFENEAITPEEWQKYVEPFSKQNQVSMIYIMDAIKAIAREAIAKAEGERA